MLYATCPTCGFLLADKQLPYESGIEKILADKQLSENEKNTKRTELLDSLGVFRYCCRMRMLSYCQLEKIISKNVLS